MKKKTGLTKALPKNQTNSSSSILSWRGLPTFPLHKPSKDIMAAMPREQMNVIRKDKEIASQFSPAKSFIIKLVMGLLLAMA